MSTFFIIIIREDAMRNLLGLLKLNKHQFLRRAKYAYTFCNFKRKLTLYEKKQKTKMFLYELAFLKI